MDTSERSSPMNAYEWLKRGAIDPDTGVAWSRAFEGESSSQPEPLGRVQAYVLDGLPYQMEDELWEVELRDISKGESVTDWEMPRGEANRRHVDEVKVFAPSGVLVRRIASWTPQIAEEFARACALEARSRVLQALHDTTKVFSDAQDEDALHRPERMEVSTFLNSAAELEARAGEAHVAAHTATLLTIWCRARRAQGSPAQLASAYAEASAASRAAAARTYASEMDPEGTSGAETEAQAYVDERRRQATWLAKRLGLSDQSMASPVVAGSYY